jgi:hypothetical protein
VVCLIFMLGWGMRATTWIDDVLPMEGDVHLFQGALVMLPHIVIKLMVLFENGALGQ